MTQIAEDYQAMLAWKERALKAEKFKQYVHERLDAAGVDKHEEQNAINGCRIGARLTDVLGTDEAGPAGNGIIALGVPSSGGQPNCLNS